MQNLLRKADGGLHGRVSTVLARGPSQFQLHRGPWVRGLEVSVLGFELRALYALPLEPRSQALFALVCFFQVESWAYV
jgi:hypothetical protein